MKSSRSEVKELKCPVCNTQFTRRVPVNDEKLRYCSTTCKKEDRSAYTWSEDRKIKYSEKMKGSNNPNYGNKWSSEQKSIASARTVKKFKECPELRVLAGNANRGVRFSEERRLNISRGKIGREGKPHSAASRKKIGIKSKEKWTSEYLEKHRNKMEELGYWIPRECKSGYEIYHEEANWIGSMIEHFNEEALINLKMHGFFNPYTNSKGYVRDHVFCRMWGYMKCVPACILRHPANMKFIPHRENIQKGFSDKCTSDSEILVKLKELIILIKEFKNDWIEQAQCLDAIKAMEVNCEVC